MEEEVKDRPPRVAGMELEDAIESLVSSDGSMDRRTARTLLKPVAEDGVITWDGVEDELSHLAKVVSTPETRTELAAIGLDDARDAADEAPDLEIVRTRLDAFESRLTDIQGQVDELGRRFQRVVDPDRRDDPILQIAKEIKDVRETSNGLQRAADELQVELESFEEWLDDPEARVAELSEDIELVESMHEGLTEAVETIKGQPVEVTNRDGDAPMHSQTWKEAEISHRVAGLLLDDIRTELGQLIEWHEQVGDQRPDRLSELGARIDALSATRESIGERLDAAATQEWDDQFRKELDAFDSALKEFEPPMAWDEVEAALDDLRT